MFAATGSIGHGGILGGNDIFVRQQDGKEESRDEANHLERLITNKEHALLRYVTRSGDLQPSPAWKFFCYAAYLRPSFQVIATRCARMKPSKVQKQSKAATSDPNDEN